MVKSNKLLHIIVLSLLVTSVIAEEPSNLELLDAADLDVLLEKGHDTSTLNLSDTQELDDLESLKSDIGESLFEEQKKLPDDHIEIVQDDKLKKIADHVEQKSALKQIIDEPILIINGDNATTKVASEQKNKAPTIFDTGKEEKQLLEASKFFETKIADDEWTEISGGSKEKYVVQTGDWLWKISQRIFGSGFYYSKIWSLNPYITNPHEIEPGMTLVFDTGSSTALPQVLVEGSDEIAPLGNKKLAIEGSKLNFDSFGDNVKPGWIAERKKLVEQGVYFQYSSDATYNDLEEIGKMSLRREYEKYSPPLTSIVIQEPGEEYDSSGFDKSSKISFNVKEGFFLNTFLTKNIVQDLGEIVAKQNESVFIQRFERIYVKFDESVKVKPGDKFSVYNAGGQVSHPVSDRKGYKYHIIGQLKVIAEKDELWECEVVKTTGLVQRRDRITVYTPKIKKIVKTFNKRSIEAATIGSFRPTANGNSFGDVVYLDRGRADGVEMGNIFELFSFRDLGTGKKISYNPTYKIGEVTVISITDNFSTALISQSRVEIPVGTLALTKTEEQAALISKMKSRNALKNVEKLGVKALDELDVELYLDDLSENLLNKADRIQLTEDELEELDRQEREKSVIKDHEKDLRELERLEKQIEESENNLNSSKLDEDKFLEQHDLNKIEKNAQLQDPNGFESVNEIENDLGRKYMDEDLNSKENPYGLTEFDLEEIDELLNTKKN